MKTKMKLARVGMNMSEATIVEWRKQPGERFAAGDVIYSFETEKATQDVESAAAGTMLEILVAAGNNVAVGEAVCLVDVEFSK